MNKESIEISMKISDITSVFNDKIIEAKTDDEKSELIKKYHKDIESLKNEAK